MNRTFVTTVIAVVIAIVAVGVFSTTLVHAVWYAPDPEVATPAPYAAATSSAPARLIIPVLNINANVQQVGIKVDGSMGTPNNFTDVAWYKLGSQPGQLGSAVIDGHVDNGLSLAGVFKHLSDIKIGDDVYVQEKDGSKLHFVVIDIESYPYQNAPAGKVFNRSDKARLNLITCEGTWVPSQKTYEQRLVVFTELSPT